MKTFLKIAVIVIGVLVVLIAAAVVVVPRVVDPNAHKDQIIALVERQTGRKLSIPGDIGISVFPWLGADVGAVELGNAPGFESPVFARVEKVQVRVKILPLLSKRVEADVVSIRGLTLNLEKAKDGRTNWDDLTKPAGVEKPESGGTQPFPVAALAVGGVDIQGAAVTWTDHASGQKIAVANLSAKTSAITLVDPVDVTMGFDVDAGDAAPKARLDASARLTLDVPGQRYRLEGLALTADLKGKALPGESLRIKAAGAATVDAGKRLVELSGVRLEAGNLSFPPYTAAAVVEAGGTGDLGAMVFDLPGLKATVSLDGGGDRIRAGLTAKAQADLTGQKIVISDLALEVPEFAVKDMDARLTAPSRATAVFDMAAKTFAVEGLRLSGTLSGKALPGGSMPVDVGLGFQGDLNRQTVSVKPLRLDAMGMKTEGSLSVGSFQSDPEVKGVLTVAPFSPKALLSKLVKEPPKTADPKVLSSAELTVSFAASADAVKVDKLSASIDDTRISGSASIRRFASPDVGFDLAVDRINLDRYLPPTTQGGKPAAGAAAAPAAGAAAAATLPLETLRKLSMSGKLRFSSLTASGVKMTDVAVAVEAKDGLLRTDPVSASLYGGSFNGSVVLDARSAEPKVSFDENLSRVNLEGLFKDAGVDAGAVNLSGPTSLSAKGAVAADSALKNFKVERLDIDGSLGGRLAVGINTAGALNLGDQTWTSDETRLKLGDMNLRAKTRVTGLSSKPSVSADIAAPAFNLRQVLSQLNMLPETADAKAMTGVELNASLSASPGALSVSGLKVRMDDTRLEGSLSATLGPTPNYRFDLAVDRINLDRYLPPTTQGGKPAAGAAAAPAAGAAAAATLPLETLRKLSMGGKLRFSSLTASGVKMTDVAVAVEAKDGLLRTDPVSASLYGGSFNGSVVLDARSAEPKVSFDENLSRVNLEGLFKDAGVDAGAVNLSGPTSLSAKGAVAADSALKNIKVERLDIDGSLGGRLAVGINTAGALNLGEQTWTSDETRLKLGDMNLRAKTRVTGLSSKPSVSADIAAPAFNLRQVLSQLNMLPETADAKAMTGVELNASLSASPGALSVSGLKVRMDDTRLEGSLSATLGPTSNYRFDIRLDALDADRYLPPPKPDTQPAASTPGAAAAGLPVDALKPLSLEGKLAVGKLKIANARLSDVRVEARAKDGLLTLNPLSVTLYGGAYKGNVAVDARTGQPRLSLDEQLTGVQVGPLLKDLQGRALLSGVANATLKVGAVGATTDALTQTLAGKLNFQLKDGSIEGIDILGKICRALEGVNLGSLKKEEIVSGLLQMAVKPAKGAAAEAGGSTAFSEMHGSMTFSNGIGSNDDLLLQSPLLRVEGAGKLDLPKKRVDYKATTALVKSCEGQGGKSFRELANYPIPVTITGPLDKPDVKPDLTAGVIEMLRRKQTQEPTAPSAPKQPGQATAPQQTAPSATEQPGQQTAPKDPKKQAEDAAKDAIQKGLQELFKKK